MVCVIMLKDQKLNFQTTIQYEITLKNSQNIPKLSVFTVVGTLNLCHKFPEPLKKESG